MKLEGRCRYFEKGSIIKSTCLILNIALAFVVLGGDGSVAAENSRGYQFTVSANVNFAVSPEAFTDYYSKGYGIAFGLEFPVSPTWSLIGSADYRQFSPDEGLVAGWWPDE